jgi:hypothetical protein
MNCFRLLVGGAVLCILPLVAVAQEKARDNSRTEPRVEAQKPEGAEAWNLREQAWDFKDLAAGYEPVKGRIERRNGQGELAVWTLKLTRDFEEGTQRFHEQMRGSPFRIVLLDADRTIINEDLPATITPVPARMGDTIELFVVLPSADILRETKFIRVQRRTDVGF